MSKSALNFCLTKDGRIRKISKMKDINPLHGVREEKSWLRNSLDAKVSENYRGEKLEGT